MSTRHTAATRRIQSRLERWELDHLRRLAAQQAETIERLQRELHAAEDSAEFWREAHHGLADHLDDGTEDARVIGLTKSGEVMVIRTGGAA